MQSVFDGRYVYFPPYLNGTLETGVFTRYDTTRDFAIATSWETFDVEPTHAGVRGFVVGLGRRADEGGATRRHQAARGREPRRCSRP